MSDEYIDNTLYDINFKDRKVKFSNKPKIEKFIKLFNNNNDGNVSYVDKILININNEFYMDTYIRANKIITSKMVKKYIHKLEPNYKVQNINYEFNGGPSMGVIMFDYNEIKGENIWVVELEPRLDKFLKRRDNNQEEIYQLGGFNVIDKINYLIKETINALIGYDIDKLYQLKDYNKYVDNFYYKNVSQVITHYDGNVYYTYLNIYKDGKFIDKVRVESFNNPIKWKYVMLKIIEIIKKYHSIYGYIYKLSHSVNQGLILETTNDERYNDKLFI